MRTASQAAGSAAVSSPSSNRSRCEIDGGGDQYLERRRRFHSTGPRAEKEEAQEEEEEEEEGEIRIHVTALDEVVSVNSFFTGAVFIGLSLSNHENLVSKGAGDPCYASKHLLRQLVLFEVLAFSCFLMSSLVAQGLKLQLTICSATKRLACCDDSLVLSTHPRALRVGMLVTALGSVGGTVFLMLSIINVIQLRLGVLACDSVWSKAAAIPLVVLVSSGVAVFISTVLLAFLS